MTASKKPLRKGKKKPFQGPRPALSKSDQGEVIFGFHSVYEALRAERRQFHALICSERRKGARADQIEDLARAKGIPWETVSPEALDSLTGHGLHQGLAARVSPFPVQDLNDLVAAVEDRSSPFFILLAESIEDPQNLGALIRTALSAGVDYVVIPKDRSALASPGVSRSSAGAMEHARIFQVTNVPSALRLLKEKGAWISGLDAGGDQKIFEADLTGNLVLVVGGEHKGIRPGVRNACDFIVSIPILGQVSSLNASVAGGIAMYEALRQRQGLGTKTGS